MIRLFVACPPSLLLHYNLLYAIDGRNRGHTVTQEDVPRPFCNFPTEFFKYQRILWFFYQHYIHVCFLPVNSSGKLLYTSSQPTNIQFQVFTSKYVVFTSIYFQQYFAYYCCAELQRAYTLHNLRVHTHIWRSTSSDCHHSAPPRARAPYIFILPVRTCINLA